MRVADFPPTVPELITCRNKVGNRDSERDTRGELSIAVPKGAASEIISCLSPSHPTASWAVTKEKSTEEVCVYACFFSMRFHAHRQENTTERDGDDVLKCAGSDSRVREISV